MIIKRGLVSIIIILFVLEAIGQPLKEYNNFKNEYPNADVICSKFIIELDIKMSKNSPLIAYKTAEEFFYLTDYNSGYTDRSIHYSNFYKLKDYKAYSAEARGEKYYKVEVKDFTQNDFTDDNVFFDDAKELKFMFPKISKGDKTYIENTYEINETHFLPKFSISPYVNYDNIKFVVKVTDDVDLGIDTFFWSNQNLKYSVLKKGGTTIHTWEGKSLKKLDYESNGLDINYVASQLHFRIKSYAGKKSKESVIEDLKDLYKWNCEFLEKSNEDFGQFKFLSDSIVGDEKSDFNKAAKIFDWVQNNIRYIAFEYGYEGHIPAKASVVCKERYGDCKGIANLIYNMLKSQGIEAYMVWIGTRDLPYKYTQLPSPYVDNHMIAVAKINGKFIFLDGTSNNLKFGMPSPFIQGKQAMIGLGNCKDFIIETVPVVSDSENVTYDSCYIKLNGKDVIGSGKMILYGYDRMVFLDRLDELNYKYLLDQSRSYLLKGSNRFVLDTVWVENFDKKNLPLIVNYSFKIPEYAIKIDDESYLNLNLDKISIPNKIDAKRNVAVEYRYVRQEINITCLELGSNIKGITLPESKQHIDSEFVFENYYSKKGNYIYRKSNYIKKPITIYPEQFASFNSLVDLMQKNYSEQIILKYK